MVGLTFLHIAHGFACVILIDFVFFLVWDGNVQSVATALLHFLARIRSAGQTMGATMVWDYNSQSRFVC
jgi:hypothetical protein